MAAQVIFVTGVTRRSIRTMIDKHSSQDTRGMDERYWFLKNCDLFERLSAEELAGLEPRCRSKTFARKSLVYVPSDQGDSVLLLASGRVKIYHLTAEGKQGLLALIEPGELFGEFAVFEGRRRDEFAETMQRSTVISIPRLEMVRLMERHPQVTLEVTRLMGLRRERVERRLKSLLFRSNRHRLIHLLLELAEKYGRTTPDGVLIAIKLSHQEMANSIGSTRETVTVQLGELQHEGAIVVRQRQIVLRDVDRLAAESDLPPPAQRCAQSPPDRVIRQVQFGH